MATSFGSLGGAQERDLECQGSGLTAPYAHLAVEQQVEQVAEDSRSPRSVASCFSVGRFFGFGSSTICGIWDRATRWSASRQKARKSP